MTQPLTREQYIKKARRYRDLAKITFKLQSLFSYSHHSPRKEIFIETEAGRVRTLWYGFEDDEIAPIFFDLHGGGFILGSADMDEAINLYLLGRTGCKVISIDYAKAPEHPYPVAVQQIDAVVHSVLANADKYKIDRNRAAIGGHSAGANLSTVTCMQAKARGESLFVCQVLDYPPLDLATSALEKPQPKGCISPEMALMFDACYVEPSQARDPYVSPVYASLEALAGLPPALVLLAGRDSLHDEGLRYSRMLQDAGVEVECREYPDSAHGFTYQESADTSDALDQMAAFLTRHFGKRD